MYSLGMLGRHCGRKQMEMLRAALAEREKSTQRAPMCQRKTF